MLYVSSDGDDRTPSVIASFGGYPRAPAWLLNIRDDPRVTVRTGGERWQGVARIATAGERQELLAMIGEIVPGYGRYQSRTTRIFPIVIITLMGD